MRITVAEYAVGVGAGESKSISLLREGKAMLETLKRSFERLGNEVICPASKQNFERAIEKLSKKSDAGLVIAPDDKLCELTKIIESNTVNLGCSSHSVKICADKMQTTKILAENEIPVPRIVDEREIQIRNEQKYVKKLRYGCASENVFILNGEECYNSKDNDVFSFGDENDYMVTEFIKGVDISSSIVVSSSSILPLTINKQFMKMDERGRRLRYKGGLVPYLIDPEAKRGIMHMSNKVATLLRCEGYVGIDFVLGDDGTPYVVDVNPRPTTSIVGIARVLNFELADLILRAKFRTLPLEAEVKIEGSFVFDKSTLS
jgi:hypothetical protein